MCVCAYMPLSGVWSMARCLKRMLIPCVMLYSFEVVQVHFGKANVEYDHARFARLDMFHHDVLQQCSLISPTFNSAHVQFHKCCGFWLSEHLNLSETVYCETRLARAHIFICVLCSVCTM